MKYPKPSVLDSAWQWYDPIHQRAQFQCGYLLLLNDWWLIGKWTMWDLESMSYSPLIPFRLSWGVWAGADDQFEPKMQSRKKTRLTDQIAEVLGLSPTSQRWANVAKGQHIELCLFFLTSDTLKVWAPHTRRRQISWPKSRSKYRHCQFWIRNNIWALRKQQPNIRVKFQYHATNRCQ